MPITLTVSLKARHSASLERLIIMAIDLVAGRLITSRVTVGCCFSMYEVSRRLEIVAECQEQLISWYSQQSKQLRKWIIIWSDVGQGQSNTDMSMSPISLRGVSPKPYSER